MGQSLVTIHPFSVDPNVTQDPTGFQIPASVGMDYDSTTRKVTLSGTCNCFWRGAQIPELVPGYVSPAHANTNGKWYLFYDADNGVHWSQTAWTFDLVQITFVNFGATNKYALREPHGIKMSCDDHEEFHDTLGTYRISGGDLSGYTLSSTTAAERRPLVSSCTIKDEDIKTTLPPLSTELYTQLYLSSTNSVNYVVDAADIIPLSTNQPYYNQWNGSAWVQTLMPNNSYAAVWLVAVPVTSDAGSQKYRFLWVQPQSQSGTLSTIQALQTTDVSLGELTDLVPEFVFIEKTIIRYTSGNWIWIETRALTGTRKTQVSSISGFFLSAVEHGATLTGDGTVLNPLELSGLDTNGVTIANRNDSFLDSLYFG